MTDSTERRLRIGFYQFAPELGKRDANLSRVEAALDSAPADIVVLPELMNTGYLFADRAELAERAEDARHGATVQRLQALSRNTGIAIVAGIAEKDHLRLFNSAIVLVPEATAPVMLYRKIHLFQREKELFDPGDIMPAVCAVKGVRIGIAVCFDYFFPELARALALKGAQVICHPSNLVKAFAQPMTVTRALENRVFWVLCNRTGAERSAGTELAFTGKSQIVSPAGELLAQAGADEEVLKIVEIDPAQADDKKPFAGNDVFADRRPEMYEKG